jgi:uncharacterized protein (DUF111 family)
VVNEMPEYEQCRAAAIKASVPLRVVESAVRLAFALGKAKQEPLDSVESPSSE